jgi:flagellar hook-associated protein 2
MPGIISAGIGSGLDISGLISKLVAAEGAAKTSKLNLKEARTHTAMSALGSLKGVLSDFKNSLTYLQKFNQFDSRIANNSDNSILSVSVTTEAPVAAYTLQVSQMAQSAKLCSSGYASPDTVIGSGQLTFQFGTYDSGNNSFTLNPDAVTNTVTIEPNAQTLQGVSDAVNKANIGVTAAVIYDGNSYNLLFSSVATGERNSLKITAVDADGNQTNMAGLSLLAYDPTAPVGAGKNMTQKVPGKDAQFTVDGIPVSSASNTVTDVIPGITMNLHKADATKQATTLINVTQNPGVQSTAASNFVDSYNKLISAIQELSGYNAQTDTPGPLQGDATLRNIDTQIRRIISHTVNNVQGPYKSLADVGISTQSDGRLKLDSTKLNEVIAKDPQALGAIFAAGAVSSDPMTTVLGIGKNTMPGIYDMHISALATQASVTGNAPAATLITHEVNDTLVIGIDNLTATITLTPGSYTPETLATELQAEINGLSTFAEAGIAVTVEQTNGVLTVTSDRYGSLSVVDLIGGNAKSDLFGVNPSHIEGADVAGSLGGIRCTGTGQELLGTGTFSDLRLKIMGGSLGERGTVSITRGVGNQLDTLLEQVLDPVGILFERNQRLTHQIDEVKEGRAQLEARLETYRQRLTTQFTALDTLMGTLKTSSDFLTQQLANLPGSHRSNNRN